MRVMVTLDEYADFIVSEKKRLEAGQADRIGKAIEGFLRDRSSLA